MLVGSLIASLVLTQPGGNPLPAAQPSSVHLRGHVSALSGEVVAASNGGLLFKTGDDAGRLISWDRVRTVEGPGAAVAAPFLSIADGLMRARTRLERGDTWLADQAIEPLYRQVAASEGGFAGPSGLLLAECALRSSLARNATAGATIAWLQWSAVERTRPKSSGPATAGSAQWTGGTTKLPPLTDGATGLCPQLPPIFPYRSALSMGTLRVLTQSPELQRLSGDGASSRVLAAAYSLAVRIAAGDIQPDEAVSLPAPTGDAEQFVIDVVAAQTAPSEPMRAARQRLQRRLDLLQRDTETRETADDASQAPDRTWQRAWIHAAVGRSMLAEDQPSVRRQGMIELLHVPALDGATQPGLASTALLDVIDQLRRDAVGTSSDAAIAALSSELKLRFGVDPSPLAPAAPAGVAPASEQQPIAPPPAEPSPSTPTPSTPPSKEAP